MYGFNANLDHLLERPWLITNTKSKKNGVVFIQVGAVLDFYVHATKSKLLNQPDVLADMHYLTEGSIDVVKWMCSAKKLSELKCSAAEREYLSLADSNPETVGPMFLHFMVAHLYGSREIFQEFCVNRQIGPVYFKPVLMREQTEQDVEDMALSR
jgi:hypothetical protein